MVLRPLERTVMVTSIARMPSRSALNALDVIASSKALRLVEVASLRCRRPSSINKMVMQ